MTLSRTPTNKSQNSQNNVLRTKTNQSTAPTQTNANGNGATGSTAEAAKPDPWSGHLNHLSKEQEEALVEFKRECTEKGLYVPGAEGGSEKASHDDVTLLRFLRARKFDVNGALDQFSATEEWRKENQINDLYENFDVDSYDDARRVYPQWTGRRDRRGIPIYVFEIKGLNSKNMAAYTSKTASSGTAPTHTSSKVPARLLRLFALYENMIRFVLPLCSSLDRPNPETPISSTTNIVDISGVGLKQFWNLKGHMQDASVLATANYPETLDRIFIIGAPAFFPTVWNWIKRWFDPVTTSKIFILSSSEVKSTLTDFMDPANFPKKYGGELEWEWGNMPSLDDQAENTIGSLERIGSRGDRDTEGEKTQTFIKGPVAWSDGKIEIYGSTDGQPRRRTIPVQTQDKEAPISNVSNANGVDTASDEKAALANGIAAAPEQVATSA